MTLTPRKGYDISECEDCGRPCYVLMTSPHLGQCDECRQPESPREHYGRVLDKVMEPMSEREAQPFPNPDTWIERGM